MGLVPRWRNPLPAVYYFWHLFYSSASLYYNYWLPRSCFFILEVGRVLALTQNLWCAAAPDPPLHSCTLPFSPSEINQVTMMKRGMLVCGALFLLCFASANAQNSAAAPPTQTPAPAPAPEYVNLTHLLSVAGPFHTFLNYLESTKVIDTFQNQANNTDEGITIFVPKDGAFSSLKKPSLSNLTNDQLKSLILFHALPHYYTLSDFRELSAQNPIPTFASGAYALNFTDNSGTIRIDSGWTRTKVISAVHAADPVAIYEIDGVLLPEAIFGTDIPPMPAPAPAPEISPAADRGRSSDSSSPTSSPSSSHRMIVNLGHVAAAIVGGILMIMMK